VFVCMCVHMCMCVCMVLYACVHVCMWARSCVFIDAILFENTPGKKGGENSQLLVLAAQKFTVQDLCKTFHR